MVGIIARRRGFGKERRNAEVFKTYTPVRRDIPMTGRRNARRVSYLSGRRNAKKVKKERDPGRVPERASIHDGVP